MRAWKRAAALVLAVLLVEPLRASSQPPAKTQLREGEDPNGSAIAIDIVKVSSWPPVEVSLDLREEPVEVGAPDGWRHSVSEEQNCGWRVLWTKDRGSGGEEGYSETWISGFEAKLGVPFDELSNWCRYVVSFEDGMTTGGFAYRFHP